MNRTHHSPLRSMLLVGCDRRDAAGRVHRAASSQRRSRAPPAATPARAAGQPACRTSPTWCSASGPAVVNIQAEVDAAPHRARADAGRRADSRRSSAASSAMTCRSRVARAARWSGPARTARRRHVDGQRLPDLRRRLRADQPPRRRRRRRRSRSRCPIAANSRPRSSAATSSPTSRCSRSTPRACRSCAWAIPTRLKPGQWVVAIGSPFGLDHSVTAGIVSAVGRTNPYANQRYVPFIQTDVAINQGNSGGPLLNTRGEVVGINSQIFSNSGGYMGVSFAIPIDVAMSAVEQLRVDRQGQPRPARRAGAAASTSESAHGPRPARQQRRAGRRRAARQPGREGRHRARRRDPRGQRPRRSTSPATCRR